MYQDPFKYARKAINQTTLIPFQLNNYAQKPLIEVQKIMNLASRQMKPNIQPIKFDNSALLRLNVQTILNAQQIRNNLFSENILKDIIKSTSISKYEVLKMSNAFRNFSVDVVSTSTFAEPINSSHPVDKPKESQNTKRFDKMLNVNHVTSSSKNYINEVSIGIGVNASWDFLSRLAYDHPINAPLYIWVLFFSFLFHLLTNEPEE
ncbi:hypothetical protein [Staphylococcus americanisciuri]|uniref:Uncharacterized protein n=1 Tax=Staphylococcus americanisciuri TaxID=2973940 RepID=A0ABT2F422_9STAP|nr:hypothetical protein [Staphylococcus americanisciuri]MCS4487224.1 hypothetical protein [Staphylococcus americanisciuri]